MSADSTLTLERIAELRRLEEEATEGPRHVSRLIGDGNHVAYGDAFVAADEYGVAYCDSGAGEDAPLIAALRNAAPELLDAAEEANRFRALVDKIRVVLDESEDAGDAAMEVMGAIERFDAALESVGWGESSRVRCEATAPDPSRAQCGLDAGHDGQHTILTPSGAPWFASPTTAKGGG